MSLNKVILIGNVGKEPELRQSKSGPFLALSVATSSKWKDKQGNKQEATEWHNVIMFGKMAEMVDKHMSKGSKVYIEGAISTKKSTDNNGVDRWNTSIIAKEIQFLDNKNGNKDGQPSDNRGNYY